jgi:outer membrane protein assembly factor BamA
MMALGMAGLTILFSGSVLSAQTQGLLTGFKIKPENLIFVGNRVFSTADLRSIFQNAGNLMGTLSAEKIDVYDNRRLNLGVNALLAFYRNRGFIKTEVKPPEINYGNSSSTGQIQLIFQITEDIAYFWGEVTISGAQIFPQPVLLGMLNPTPKAPLNITKIDSGIALIREAYLNLGFLDVEVTSTVDTLPNRNIANLSVAIREGRQYHVGRIQIAGTPAIRETLVREVLPLQKGDLFGERAFKTALDSLTSLGLPHPLTTLDVDFNIDRNQSVVDMVIYLEGKVKKEGAEATRR